MPETQPGYEPPASETPQKPPTNERSPEEQKAYNGLFQHRSGEVKDALTAAGCTVKMTYKDLRVTEGSAGKEITGYQATKDGKELSAREMLDIVEQSIN